MSLGGHASNLAPTEDGYETRFLTPGSSWGVSADLDAPGILCFTLMVERFEKRASEATDWDGEVSATLVSALPSARVEVVRGLRLGAGPCAVFADGDYAGSDAFGRFVEASGSSLGFGFDVGLDLVIWGPVSGRLSFRRTFMDVKTDQAEIDGETSSLYPSVETDLGYSQFGFTLLVSLVGGESSVLGGF